jgi:hypothetical protein
LAITDLRSMSPLMQYVSNFIAGMPEVSRFKRRLAVTHIYGTGNAFADAGNRGDNERIARPTKRLRVSYERVPLPARALRFIEAVRARTRQLAGDARRPDEAKRSNHQSRGKDRARQRNRKDAKHEKPRPHEHTFGKKYSSAVTGDGPKDGESPPRF